MRHVLQVRVPPNDGLTDVMRTACRGAAMRAVESDLVIRPLIEDPIAKLLAGGGSSFFHPPSVIQTSPMQGGTCITSRDAPSRPSQRERGRTVRSCDRAACSLLLSMICDSSIADVHHQIGARARILDDDVSKAISDVAKGNAKAIQV